MNRAVGGLTVLGRFIAVLNRHRERVAIVGVIVVFFLLIGGGLYLQGKKRAGEERHDEFLKTLRARMDEALAKDERIEVR